jgi:hypothetical protein
MYHIADHSGSGAAPEPVLPENVLRPASSYDLSGAALSDVLLGLRMPPGRPPLVDEAIALEEISRHHRLWSQFG